MDPDNRSPKDNKPPRPGAPGGGDPNFNWRSLIIIAIFFGLVAAYWIVHNGPNASSEEVHYDDFIKYLANDNIYKDETHPLELLIEEGSSTQTLSGYYSKLVPARAGEFQAVPHHGPAGFQQGPRKTSRGQGFPTHADPQPLELS